MSTILVPLAEGFEETEAILPIDIWRRAGFHVTVAGLTNGPVRACWHTLHVPDAPFHDVSDGDYDLIYLPGGQPGANNLAADPTLGNKIQQQAQKGKWLAAICAAPLVLKKYGLLENKKFTCYPSVCKDLNPPAQSAKKRCVIDGKIITAQGPGVALELAIRVTALLGGKEKAQKINSAVLGPSLRF